VELKCGVGDWTAAMTSTGAPISQVPINNSLLTTTGDLQFHYSSQEGFNFTTPAGKYLILILPVLQCII